jgi:hypothetical protein
MSDSPHEPGGVPSTSRDANAVRPVIAGTLVAAVALLVLLTQRDRLAEDDATWWIGVAAVATVLGLIGIVLVTRRIKR